DDLEARLAPVVVDAGEVRREVVEEIWIVPEERQDLAHALARDHGGVVAVLGVGAHHRVAEAFLQPFEGLCAHVYLATGSFFTPASARMRRWFHPSFRWMRFCRRTSASRTCSGRGGQPGM